MRVITWLILAGVVIVVLVFTVLNAQSVSLNLYFTQRDLPLSLAMALAFAVGALLGLIAAMGLVVRLRRENRALKKEVDFAEKELIQLRNLPIQDMR